MTMTTDARIRFLDRMDTIADRYRDDAWSRLLDGKIAPSTFHAIVGRTDYIRWKVAIKRVAHAQGSPEDRASACIGPFSQC
jgi:hypothetical protein